VHIEAYKKLILLSLIQEGRLPHIPKYTDQLVKYKLENSLLTYKNLAQHYISKHDQYFQNVINECFEEFQKDANIGLIKKLQKTYS